MPTKMTLYFNQLASGFSETFYHPSNTPSTLAASLSNAFYQTAVKFRSTDTILKGVRFSSTLPPRASVLVRPYPIAQGTSGAAADPGPEVVSTTAVFLLQSISGGERRLYMRGLADSDVKRDIFGNDTPSAALVAGTNNYFGALYAAGFCVRVSQRPPNAGLLWSDVINVTSDLTDLAGSTSFQVSIQNQTFNSGDVLQFNKVPETLPRWPRKAIVTRVDSNVGNPKYYVAYGIPGGVTLQFPKMLVTKTSYDYRTISLWYFERFSEHKTGRPFGSLRGRARAV